MGIFQMLRGLQNAAGSPPRPCEILGDPEEACDCGRDPGASQRPLRRREVVLGLLWWALLGWLLWRSL